MKYCKCHNVLTLKEGVMGLLDEVKEFIDEPSYDEGSDIVYSINRIAGTIMGKEYIKVLPWDKTHVNKINERMLSYGCIRSTRHLINGKCPSA